MSMSAFQLAQKRNRARVARRNSFSSDFTLELKPVNKLDKAAPFSDDPSDDETSSKKTVRVTSVAATPAKSTSLPGTAKKHTRCPLTSGETVASKNTIQTTKPSARQKGSQIARLLQRRRALDATMSADIATTTTMTSSHPSTQREDALFRAQLLNCADDASLDAYRSTPVDGFGAAMLRAMGWTGPAEQTAPDDDPVAPRPDRLGLGAKLTDGALPPPSRKRRRLVLAAEDTTPVNQDVRGVVASSDAHSPSAQNGKPEPPGSPYNVHDRSERSSDPLTTKTKHDYQPEKK